MATIDNQQKFIPTTNNSEIAANDAIQLQSSGFMSSQQLESSVKSQETGVESYRWFILWMYIGLNASIALSQNGFAAITTKTADIYGISDQYVESIGLSYLILFTPTELLYLFAYKRQPMSWVLKQCALFQIVGSWLRLFAATQGSFFWVVFGNFFVAWTNAPIQMATVKVSERWFGPEERTIAVAGQSLAFIVGGIASFILGPLFVGENATESDVQRFMFYQSVVITVFSLPTLFFFVESPKIPTSIASEQESKISTKEDFKLLCKNLNFHLLMWNFTMSTIIYDLIAILVDPLTEGYYTSFEVVTLALIFVISGIFGLIVVTFIIDRKKKYLLVQRAFSWSSVVIMVLAALTLKTGIYPLFASILALAGFFIIPTTAAAIAFSGEVSYPVESSMSNGFVSLAGHTTAAIVGIFCSWLVGKSQTATLWFFVLVTLIGGILTLFMTEDLRRTKAEKLQVQKQELSESDLQGTIEATQEAIQTEQFVANTEQQE